MIKKHLKSMFIATCLLVGWAFCADAITFTEYVYYNAGQNNFSAIEHYLYRGYNIDAPDRNGMTALCYAAARNNTTAYRNLKKLGASDKKECMRRINTPKAKKQPSTPIKAVTKNSNNTLPYTVVGLAAAGGITAAVLAGNGHGSHHSTPQKTCPEGQILVGDTCMDNDPCPIGQYWDGTQCVDITCEEGYHLEGDECVPDTPSGDCPTGQHKVGDECVDIECPENTHLVGNRCVADEIDKIHIGDDDLYAIYSNNERIYNLYSTPKYPEDTASIKLRNIGNGNVYGMYGYGGDTEVFNAYVVGELDGKTSRKPVGTATISITDTGSGNVYGMYSQITDITQYKEAINVSAYNNGTAYGNINITHTGGGASYGILGDVRAYNTYAAYGGKGYGNINITGDGDIYGISGYVATANAVDYSLAGYTEGNINLTSTGDGDIYGMMVNKDDIPGAGAGSKDNIASWFSLNSIAFWQGNGTVVGNINIHNTGNGNAYGMYGGQQLHNALSNGSSASYGTISIVNLGNGNSYGMYMPEADNKGIITNANDSGAQSVIRIVNAGSGTATGMHGGQQNTVNNGGEISIDNLGSGTAIGIYGEANSKITNTGTINIYRTAYNDNGTIINPATPTGGTAYGIYAESGSLVNNSGTIIITDAGAGKGIYIEEGATLINTGTVTFNGEEQDSGVGLSSLNLNSLGGGEIILAQGGQFFADTLSGTLGISNQSVLGSMYDEYTLGRALQANDIDNLNLSSKSAMFTTKAVSNASGNGYDVVLTRKNFNTLIDNESLAQFFELNYKEGNNSALYDMLKTQSSASGINQAAATVSGNNIIPSFRREDMQIYSNVNRQFNDNLFNHPEQRYIGGYKYIDISRKSEATLEGNDGEAHIAYGLLKNKTSNGITYGLGASIAQLKSDYDNGSKRHNNIFGLWAPIGYNLGNDTRFVSKLYTGYTDGDYDRKVLGNKYSADTKSYQYGLSNEMRHTLHISNGLKFTPAAELNLFGVHQDGFNEGTAVNALKVESNDSLSLEGGLGAYLTKEFEFDTNNKLGIQIGGIYYVEFLEPDDGLKASMIGMNQKYKIQHNFHDTRAVFSARLNYNYKNMTLYGLIEQETNGYKGFNIDAGLQYHFN